MASMPELSVAELQWMRPHLPPARNEAAQERRPACGADSHTPGRGHIAHEHALDRPWVTLTYACSLDGMISLAPGTRTTLSGAETKTMTHYLRSKHDAILVGVGTAIADDPGLNCRYPGTEGVIVSQPRPCILDPSQRWDASASKVRALFNERKGLEPWTIHNNLQESVENGGNFRDPSARVRIECSDKPAYKLPDVSQRRAGPRMDWEAILSALKLQGIGSIMIEGGATIINDLLNKPHLVDKVIITIAPVYLGQGSVVVSPEGKSHEGARVAAARFADVTWRQFGQDVVMCANTETP